MKLKVVVSVVVSSPEDVRAEREAVRRVAELLNSSILRERNVLIEIFQWERNAKPGFHPDGRQIGIDEDLKIEDADLFIGIFWKRYGTTVHDGLSGTEHEYTIAYEAWKKERKPQIFFYFRSVSRKDQAGKDQRRRIGDFQARFPGEGLWWRYRSVREFENLLTRHLFKFVEERVKFDAELISILEALLEESTQCDTAVKQSKPVKASPPIVRKWPFVFDSFYQPRLALASIVTVVLMAGVLLWWHSSNQRYPELARVIETEVHPQLPTLTLIAPVISRSESVTEVPQLPQLSGPVRLQLIFPRGQDSESYDLTLVEARSDQALFNVRGLTCKNQTITLKLNQDVLPAGRYRLTLFREGELVGIYFFKKGYDR